ncbi:HAAS signaling domain-containing protein [Kutzneria kofuensis]|uniref:Uncharacterized protein n=1 Tax=Kutzneria kofuensis TaxID=103725 RepID=A0A7W9KK57_9PSEU|nr:hypothetical protein [Kutzneria kofuensis]MBB5894076.1 hypothetical protein [Kutzneria kofuensis]
MADVREDDGSTTERFLTRMRAALSDLPPAEVDELLEDTEEHVRELAREHGEDQLELRLGSPEAYAAELRSAAGYPPPPEPEQPAQQPKTPRNDGVEVLALAGLIVTTASAMLFGASIRSYHSMPLFLLTGLVGLAISLPMLVRGPGALHGIAELPTVRALTPYLTPDESTLTGKVLAYVYSLQPAWWLLRVLPIVLLSRAGLVGLVVLGLPAAVISILVGHYSRVDRRLLWLVVPGNALVGTILLYYFVAF